MLSRGTGEVMMVQPWIDVAEHTEGRAASLRTSHLMCLTPHPTFSLGGHARILESRVNAWTPSPSMCGGKVHLRLDGAWA